MGLALAKHQGESAAMLHACVGMQSALFTSSTVPSLRMASAVTGAAECKRILGLLANRRVSIGPRPCHPGLRYVFYIATMYFLSSGLMSGR